MAAAKKQRSAIGLVSIRPGAPADLELQRQQIEQYCQRRRLALKRVVDSLPQAIEAAAKAKAALIVAGLEYVGESAHECIRLAATLQQRGIDLIAVAQGLDTAASAGKSFFAVMQALGKLDHDRLARRLPYGYQVADDLEHIVLEPRQQDVIRRMVRLYAQGRMVGSIAEELNRQNEPGPHGRSWDAAAVQDVLDHAPTSRWGDAFSEPQNQTEVGSEP